MRRSPSWLLPHTGSKVPGSCILFRPPRRGFSTWMSSRALPAVTPPGLAPPSAGPQLGPEPVQVVDDKLPAAPVSRAPRPSPGPPPSRRARASGGTCPPAGGCLGSSAPPLARGGVPAPLGWRTSGAPPGTAPLPCAPGGCGRARRGGAAEGAARGARGAGRDAARRGAPRRARPRGAGAAGSWGGAPARDAVKGKRRGSGDECLGSHWGLRAVPFGHPGHLRLQPPGCPARVSGRARRGSARQEPQQLSGWG